MLLDQMSLYMVFDHTLLYKLDLFYGKTSRKKSPKKLKKYFSKKLFNIISTQIIK